MTSPPPSPRAPLHAHRLLLPVAVSAIGLSLLMAAQLTVTRAAIEHRLQRHAAEALIRTGITGIDVTVDGRDATLHGMSTSDLDAHRALDTVADIDGVRAAHSEITVHRGAAVEGEGGEPEAVQLTAAILGGRITLTGTIPDDDTRDRLVEAAASQVGEDDVIDDLQITDKFDDLPAFRTIVEGAEAMTAVVDALDPAANGLVELADGVITLTGRVPSQAARDAIVAGANSVLADPSRIVDLLTIEDDVLTAEAQTIERRLAKLPEIDFSAGGSRLTGDALEIVRDAAKILDAAPNLRVRVEGHTDASGNTANNLALSQDRADAVRDALVDEGVAADRIDAVGYGESRPLATPTPTATEDDEDKENRADLNRRVVFEILP